MRDQISSIYERAIAQYDEITKTKLEEATSTGLTTLGDLEKAIDSNQNDFSAFREKRHKIFSVLSASLRPVEQVGGLAASGASLAFPPSSLVFGAVTLLLGAAKNVSAKYDAIIVLFEKLKVCGDRFHQLCLTASYPSTY
jgi:hypothetical protein